MHLLQTRPSVDEVDTQFDEHRDRLIDYVNRHRQQLRGILKCPLKEDERGCYQCSDAMVTTCIFLNEKKMKD